MDSDQAVAFLEGLLGKTLRVHASDGRIFVGQMKCTDNERNVILGGTHEYRMPTQSTVQSAAMTSPTSGPLRVNMSSRFLGLVVVPGAHITKIEKEQRMEDPGTHTKVAPEVERKVEE